MDAAASSEVCQSGSDILNEHLSPHSKDVREDKARTSFTLTPLIRGSCRILPPLQPHILLGKKRVTVASPTQPGSTLNYRSYVLSQSTGSLSANKGILISPEARSDSGKPYTQIGSKNIRTFLAVVSFITTMSMIQKVIAQTVDPSIAQFGRTIRSNWLRRISIT